MTSAHAWARPVNPAGLVPRSGRAPAGTHPSLCRWRRVGLPQLSRDTTMVYGVGRVDASGRVSNRDIVRALGWRPGTKLDVILTLAGIVVLSSPQGLFRMSVKPYIVIPAAARRLHNIDAGDHVLLAAAPAYGVVVIHTRQAMNDMLVRYHASFPPSGDRHE
jgi:hypothetical protein